MADWLVNVVVTSTGDQAIPVKALADTLVGLRSTPPILLIEERRLEVGTVVGAESAIGAAAIATETMEHALSDLGLSGAVVSVQASTTDEARRALARGEIPELIDNAGAERYFAGLSETAELLGVSRSRVAALRARSDFPRPVAELASGPVWVAREIEAFAQRWTRQSGRPAGGRISLTSDGQIQSPRPASA
jgi:predicted DNA-binding transcriptional regulator AlpA